MAPPKGSRNNPNGRPRRTRALTEILQAAGSTTIAVGDKRVARKRLLADLMWQLATTGQVTLPDVVGPNGPLKGRTLTGGLDDQMAAVRWIYSQIDGPPRQDVTLDGEITTVIRRYVGVDLESV